MNLARWLVVPLLVACGDNFIDDGVEEEPEPLAATCNDSALVATLAALPSVTKVTEASCGDYVENPARCFSIAFDQPIDHADPASKRFTQQLWLTHRGCDRPNLIGDWGYSQDYFFDDELSVLYGTNALWVEHRYQGASLPATEDWKWEALTIENGATDLHRIIEAFRGHYPGNFVSTGASKGGITATYHAFFFRDDLDGSIPYVAPASRAPIDPTYQRYLDRHMSSPCAQNIRAAQVDALTTRRAMMLQRLAAVAPGLEQLYLEYMTSSYDWGFWQYYGVGYCGQVPGPGASDDALWSFFARDFFGNAAAPARDAERSDGALVYEWLSEQGFALQYGVHVAPHLSAEFKAYTMEESFREAHPDANLPPHSGSVTALVRRWVEERAQNMLLIYGELDPWSGGAMAEPAHPTSARFFVPNATHGAFISDLPPAEEAAALAHATRMFGAPPRALRREARAAGANRQHIIEQLHRRQRAVATGLLLPR
ncbi:MAG: hypothetical protein H0T89_15290 [Deltaproteobacteria bacterium]|nr:hypothetical protein [Deltaproteobacteria bacterium]MDQ3297313.1 hypothetical protein [Myxococcota bacterium]